MGVIAGFLMPHPPIMVAEVGGPEAKRVSATIEASKAVGRKIAQLRPDTIVIISPHGPIFQDTLCIYDYPLEGDLRGFGAPQVQQNYESDEDLRGEILRISQEWDIPVALTSEVPMERFGLRRELDHGVTVPMHFVRQFASDYKLLPLSFGLLPYGELYRFGIAIQEASEALGKSTVVIASGDLSHHLTHDAPAGYDPHGAIFDESLMDILGGFDIPELYALDPKLIESAGECGLRSLWIMAGSLDRALVESEVLSYEGPFGVGYGVAKFLVRGKGESRWDAVFEVGMGRASRPEEKMSPHVILAKRSLETYVRTGRIMELSEDLPGEMLKGKKGVFVSLKSHGRLRGCIGTFMPTRANLAEEILHNAIAAGTQDSRFNPVQPGELESISYSVDVLTEPEAVDSVDMLDPKRYGVIVEKGFRKGLLLPDLDGVDTVDEQLEIALQKAGIGPGEGYNLSRFEVVRHL